MRRVISRRVRSKPSSTCATRPRVPRATAPRSGDPSVDRSILWRCLYSGETRAEVRGGSPTDAIVVLIAAVSVATASLPSKLRSGARACGRERRPRLRRTVGSRPVVRGGGLRWRGGRVVAVDCIDVVVVALALPSAAAFVRARSSVCARRARGASSCCSTGTPCSPTSSDAARSSCSRFVLASSCRRRYRAHL